MHITRCFYFEPFIIIVVDNLIHCILTKLLWIERDKQGKKPQKGVCL